MIRHLALTALLLATPAATALGDDARAEVRRLVVQLDAPQLIQREAAEAALLGRGPAILDLLPPGNDRTSAEVRERLGRIRQKLQQAAADASVHGSTITLHAKDLRLSEILRAFQTQSGNTIVDDRQQSGQPATDPALTVRFDKTPFWAALDQLLDQAGLVSSPHAQQRAIGVVSQDAKKPARVGRPSYSGPFRFQAVAIVARPNLREPDAGLLVVTLEVCWEPRLRIISLVQPMANLIALDGQGEPVPVADPAAQPESPVSGKSPAAKFDLPFQLPPRKVHEIASLKGQLLATIPGKVETFRFGALANAKNVQQRIAGVTVTLEQVRQLGKAMAEGTRCEIRLHVRFDDAGDALASHRQWIFSNPAYLAGPDGTPIPYDTFETTAQSKNELGLAFFFSTARPLDQITFIYQTPGTIVTRGFPYELKKIALP